MERSSTTPTFESGRFVGIHLSGVRGNKTSLVVARGAAGKPRLFVEEIFRDLTPETGEGDASLLDALQEVGDSPVDGALIDVPLELPPCVSCTLFRKIDPCPTFARCDQTEIAWMRRRFAHNQEIHPVPYLQRPVDYFLRENFSDYLDPRETMGSNEAPLLARWIYLSRHLPFVVKETIPKLSLKLLVLALKLRKTLLAEIRDPRVGMESRRELLKLLIDKKLLFVYDSDLEILCRDVGAFDALIASWTAFLVAEGLCEPMPEPVFAHSGWVMIPNVSKINEFLKAHVG